jgi:hypothetical protein
VRKGYYTRLNVVVVNGDVIIAIRSALLVIETESVQEFVLRCSWFASGGRTTETTCVERKSLWLQNSWSSTDVAVASLFEGNKHFHFCEKE